LNNYKLSGHVSDSEYNTCKNNFNSGTAQLLQSQLSKYKSEVSNLVYDVSTDNNALYVSLKSPPFPAFIIDLNAKSVGIIALKGKPKITQCVSDQKLESGKNQVVSFTVLNDANVNNPEFATSILCGKGITAFTPNFNIGANQQKTITTELIPSNPNQNVISSLCTIKVTDIKSGKSQVIFFLIGQIKKELGDVDVSLTQKIIDEIIKS